MGDWVEGIQDWGGTGMIESLGPSCVWGPGDLGDVPPFTLILFFSQENSSWHRTYVGLQLRGGQCGGQGAALLLWSHRVQRTASLGAHLLPGLPLLPELSFPQELGLPVSIQATCLVPVARTGDLFQCGARSRVLPCRPVLAGGETFPPHSPPVAHLPVPLCSSVHASHRRILERGLCIYYTWFVLFPQSLLTRC